MPVRTAADTGAKWMAACKSPLSSQHSSSSAAFRCMVYTEHGNGLEEDAAVAKCMQQALLCQSQGKC